MPFCCVHLTKLTHVNLAAVLGHNARTISCVAADPLKTRDNITLLESPNLRATIEAKVTAAFAGKKTKAGRTLKIKPNAVKAVEVLLTASPEYFRPPAFYDPNATAIAGDYDTARMHAWVDASWQFLQVKFGDSLVDARVHLDESTPHIHAVFVPITPDGRLCAKDITKKGDLRRLQSEYADALKHLGIRRGIEGSRAKHEPIKEFYKATKTRDLTENLAVKITPPPLLLTEKQRAAWAAAEEKRLVTTLNTALKPFELAVKNHKLQQKQLDEKTLTIKALDAERNAERNAHLELQKRLRDLPLADVLEKLGLVQDENEPELWRNAERAIKLKGSKWFDDTNLDTPAKGTNSIDLAAHVLQCKPREAIGWLRDNYGAEAIVAPILVHTESVANEAIGKAPSPPPFNPPERNDVLWPKVHHYLTIVRKISAWIVDALHKLGTLYADAKGNAVFLFNQINGNTLGAELRGTDPNSSFKGLSVRSTRAYGAYQLNVRNNRNAPLGPVVLVEGALDALSYYELHPDTPVNTLILSTAGVRSTLPEGLDINRPIVIAFDTDVAGNAHAQRLESAILAAGGKCERRVPTEGKDWNECLVIRRERERRVKRDVDAYRQLQEDRARHRPETPPQAHVTPEPKINSEKHAPRMDTGPSL